MADTLGVWIEPVNRNQYARHVDLGAVVAMPILPRDRVRVMWVGHRHDETERPVVLATRDVEPRLTSGAHSLVSGSRSDWFVCGAPPGWPNPYRREPCRGA